jgi:hypothetical protein
MRFFKGEVKSKQETNCPEADNLGFERFKQRQHIFNLAGVDLEENRRKISTGELSYGFIMGEASDSHMREYTDFAVFRANSPSAITRRY